MQAQKLAEHPMYAQSGIQRTPRILKNQLDKPGGTLVARTVQNLTIVVDVPSAWWDQAGEHHRERGLPSTRRTYDP